MDPAYQDITWLLMVSAAVGLLALRLKQPLIVAFVVVGLLVGPSGFGWVRALDAVDLLAQIGITILLFLVGLKLDLRLVRQLGPVALATGLGQLFFTIGFGFLLALLLGLETMTAFYVAVALTFSSTIIIVKLLSDKHEIDALHGRIAMGFLIVQDIAVVVAMALMSAYRGEATVGALGMTLLEMGLKLAVVLASILLLMRYLLPRLMRWLAEAPELLVIFAVGWGTSLAAAGVALGLGKEVGAFLAGFSLATTAQREVLSGRMATLRDFLLLFFFIDLGTKLDLGSLGAEVPSAIVLSLFVLIGNPLIVLAIMGYMGYRRRTGFLAGLTVAQISEFSILFIALGISLGHIRAEALGLVTLVGLITITLSTYMILYSDRLYRWCGPWLGAFERRHPYRELQVEQRASVLRDAEVVIVGLGRYGLRVARLLQGRGVRLVGVEFDPDVARRAEEADITVIPGDINDPELLAALPRREEAFIISTLPQGEVNLRLWRELQRAGSRAQVAMTGYTERDLERLSAAGVTRLLTPYADAADHVAETLLQDLPRGHAAAGKR